MGAQQRFQDRKASNSLVWSPEDFMQHVTLALHASWLKKPTWLGFLN